MTRFVTALLILLVCAASARSSPIVPAYERFHTAEASVAGGRLLITELSCAACHQELDAAALPPKKVPILDGVGARITGNWMRAFLTDPAVAKPGTTMPNLLSGVPEADRKATVDALVHYLTSLNKSAVRAPEKMPGNVSADRGLILFREIGCAGCHTIPGEQPAPATIGFPDLKAKYSLETLARFLKSPLDHRPAGRMPDFLLDMQEATDLAGYLIGWDDVKASTAPKLTTIKPDAAKVAAGRKLFESMGCANCHAVAGTTAAIKSKPLADLAAWSRGCVSALPTNGVPHFSLTANQTKAIALAARSTAPDKPADRVVATMQQLNCYTCHQRDKLGGVQPTLERHLAGDPDLADEGKYPPTLTGVGRKLTPEWFARILGREGRQRPYLRLRMPVFGTAAVSPLPADFIAADGGMKDDARPLAGGDIEAGRQLLGAKGLSCITCHGLNGREAIGIRAMDLSATAQRVQPGWFRENLLNPAAVRPRTLMPTFWPEGKAANTQILGGDTDKQIAAIWAYLREGKQPIEGYPPAKGEFEVVAIDRPAILRCFMETAGTHAIAVGFPQKVHLAFDANSIRPAVAWRGKFMDGYTTWFSRNQPPVQPLGEAMVTLPAVMPLAKLSSANDAWPKATGTEAGYTFGGYRLDKQGVPTFLYKFGDIAIEDRITPAADGKGLTRTLTLHGTGDGIYFMPASAASDGALKATIPGATGTGAIPVRFEQGKATFTVEYQW